MTSLLPSIASKMDRNAVLQEKNEGVREDCLCANTPILSPAE